MTSHPVIAALRATGRGLRSTALAVDTLLATLFSNVPSATTASEEVG